MPWYLAATYDWFTRKAEQACLSAWRASLLREVSGEVLEVGAGTGANLPYYSEKVRRLVLVEPDTHMRRRLLSRVEASGKRNVKVIGSLVEALSVKDESFDFVVSTLVLCSVRSLEQSIQEIRRALKPAGQLVFLEHVAADGRPSRLKWQVLIEPLWRRLMGTATSRAAPPRR